MRKALILAVVYSSLIMVSCSSDDDDSPEPDNSGNPSDSTEQPEDPPDTTENPADTLPLKIGCYTEAEQQLMQNINEYRADKGLDKIPASKSLAKVADYHVADLNEVGYHEDRELCNLHSWSDKGPWKGCCYTDDHANSECMWNKPRQLTNYSGNGYENAYTAFGTSATPEGALASWKSSNGHNAVILNQDQWSDSEWKAMGVSIQGNYAVAWFGKKTDPAGKPSSCQ